MRADELVVEVRSLDLTRKGVIPAKLLNLSGAVRWCNVGAWSLTLPAGHPLADALRLPGAGVIVTGPDGVLWSGPAEAPDVEYSSSVPAGLVTVTGVTDDVVLGDALAWPSPASTSLTAQAGVNWPANTARSDGYWVGTGPVESLMHALVAANIGPSAPAARRGGLASKLVMGTNLGRGPTVTKRVRFQNLGQALAELAAGSGVGFRVVQDGPTLKFETFATADRSGFVRFTVQNDRLTSQSVAIAAPGVTRPLVAGQGEGAARTLVAPTTPESVAAEAAWGRRIERFIDQRQTDDTTELTQAGLEALAETGFTRVAVTSVTGDDQSMRWGRDFGLGDTVAVEVEGTETTSFITGLALVAGPDGVRTGADLGDTSNVDETRAVASRLSSLEGRASSLERTAEAGTTVDWSMVVNEPATFPPDDHNHTNTYPLSPYFAAPSDSAISYPLGISTFLAFPATGWPSSTEYGVLVTFRGFLDQNKAGGTFQLWSPYRGDATTGIGSYIDGVYKRHWFYNAAQWGPWARMDGPPVGSVQMFASGNIPAGWLLCNGAAVSRTTYAALWATIGTTFGAGNGSTTFNVPNLGGRFPLGASASYPIATTGGAATVALTTAHLPSHTHAIKRTLRYVPTSGTVTAYEFSPDGGDGTALSEATGGGTAHQNLPPYLALNFIIKAL